MCRHSWQPFWTCPADQPISLMELFSGKKQNCSSYDYFPQVPDYQECQIKCQIKLILLCHRKKLQSVEKYFRYTDHLGTEWWHCEILSWNRGNLNYRDREKGSKIYANAGFLCDYASKTAQCSSTQQNIFLVWQDHMTVTKTLTWLQRSYICWAADTYEKAINGNQNTLYALASCMIKMITSAKSNPWGSSCSAIPWRISSMNSSRRKNLMAQRDRQSRQ